jgi:ATP-dependent Clp protease ATP-binding subunit ClpA
MFQRFTGAARAAVVLAEEEARSLHHGRIGSEHILLGVLEGGSGAGPDVLRRFGIEAEEVRAEVVRHLGDARRDGELLESIGIDLDEVRSRAEETFGPGALDRRGRGRPCDDPSRIPFTPGAKKALELSLREAEAMRSPSIGTGHLVLGVSREGLAAEILAGHGATLAALRRAIGDLDADG